MQWISKAKAVPSRSFASCSQRKVLTARQIRTNVTEHTATLRVCSAKLGLVCSNNDWFPTVCSVSDSCSFYIV